MDGYTVKDLQRLAKLAEGNGDDVTVKVPAGMLSQMIKDVQKVWEPPVRSQDDAVWNCWNRAAPDTKQDGVEVASADGKSVLAVPKSMAGRYKTFQADGSLVDYKAPTALDAESCTYYKVNSKPPENVNRNRVTFVDEDARSKETEAFYELRRRRIHYENGRRDGLRLFRSGGGGNSHMGLGGEYLLEWKRGFQDGYHGRDEMTDSAKIEEVEQTYRLQGIASYAYKTKCPYPRDTMPWARHFWDLGYEYAQVTAVHVDA